MRKFLKFSLTYFILTVLIFLTEVCIGIYVHDTIIRPYGGDYLVVILIYCFVRSFLNTPVFQTSIAVLLFSFLIETMQYFDFVDRMGIDNKLARIVIGTSFAWKDIWSYVLGVLTVFLAEWIIRKKQCECFCRKSSDRTQY
ncbi:ribosomal maturation YjgA family protein [Flavobacterium foetidum]|uniref:ribosomal maturation YjgA family protein n=1 Tax=Flavobacterium foetidum TaxID=2026681 RepID=UPI001074BC87|nr:DUF2809 domain-containing protein [Flavobacterium foetidum]KAF2509128.1 DUF2809 domain-containing protein [Flavobacterium foetidum]